MPKVTFGFLCFNTLDISLRVYPSLVEEATSLLEMGHDVNIQVVDNGADGTGANILRQSIFYPKVTPNPSNMGSSIGRNQIISESLFECSDYTFLIDGDIRMVPGSAKVMLEYMMERPEVGCLSAHPVHQTTKAEEASSRIDKIERILNDVKSACTGYALFNNDIFRAGVRLEERGPFTGPGWGLEDDDLYLEIIKGGWAVHYFTGMTYLQPKIRSSWDGLRAAEVDIEGIWEARKEFFLNKWRTRDVDPAILMTVKGQHLPRLS